MYISIVPDGSLGLVYGNVKDSKGNGVEGCSISIDTDTTVKTNAAGIFNIALPYHMQKSQYILSLSKENFRTQKIDYFPGSGNIDLVLKK